MDPGLPAGPSRSRSRSPIPREGAGWFPVGDVVEGARLQELVRFEEAIDRLLVIFTDARDAEMNRAAEWRSEVDFLDDSTVQDTLNRALQLCETPAQKRDAQKTCIVLRGRLRNVREQFQARLAKAVGRGAVHLNAAGTQCPESDDAALPL